MKMKKAMAWSAALLLSVSIAIVAAEICFRFQCIDFYGTELKLLNPPLNKKQKTLLVLGDSFAADPAGFVTVLRKRFVNWNVVNAAVPGTGIREMSFVAPKRISDFKPQLVLVQLYAGNDLSDIHHYTSPQTSVWRKLYWAISERVLVLRWLNYKAGQLKAATGHGIADTRGEDSFNAENFSETEKTLLRAEPMLIENAAMLLNGRQRQFEVLVHELKHIENMVKQSGAEMVVLVIPHCALVNDHYRNKMEKCGAAFSPSFTAAQIQFLFAEKLKKHFELVIDPLPAFQASDSTSHRLYYANDIHLNKNGHRLLEQLVAEELLKRFTY